jgi:hypothetical protein
MESKLGCLASPRGFREHMGDPGGTLPVMRWARRGAHPVIRGSRLVRQSARPTGSWARAATRSAPARRGPVSNSCRHSRFLSTT